MEVVESKVQQETQVQEQSKEAPKKRVDGIVINDPALGGWIIHRSYGKVHIENPKKHNSRTECKDIQQALNEIFELRIVNEIQGEMNYKEFNTRVKEIQAQITEAIGGKQQ
jgi:hypothetical protein